MSDPLKNKGLADFFHQHLDHYEEEPGADFWDQLEPQIPAPPQKRRSPLLWWWLGGMLSLSLLIAYVIYNQRKVEQLEDAIIAQQALVETLREEQNTPPETSVAIASASPPATPVAPGPPVQPVAPSATPAVLPPVQNRPSELRTPATPANLPEQDLTTINNTPEERVGSTESSSLPPRATQPIPFLAPKPIVPKRQALENEATNTTTIGFTPLFEIGAYYEQWLWASGTGSNAEAADFSARGQGLQLGLRLGSHWRLSTGLGLLQLRVASRGRTILAYQSAGGTRVGNDLINSYRYDFESALGTTAYESAIGFALQADPAANYQEGQNFAIDVEEMVRINYLRLPLELAYLGGGPKWEWTLGLGVDYYRMAALRVTGRLNPVNINNTRSELSNRQSAALALAGLDDTFWAGRLNAGLAWRGAGQWRVGLRSFGQWSLTNFSAGQSLVGLGLQLGAAYEF
ncbi:MAG: hypothetical protein AAFW73_20045 [Bacteroidota bacterium]